MERKTQSIHAKLAAVMQECTAIGKTRQNQQQRFNFRGIDDVMNSLHDTFAKHSVFILPRLISETHEAIATGAKMLFTSHVQVEYTFVTDDGSSLTVTGGGEASDYADKAMNKAMSAALKYILLQMFLIPTMEKKDQDFDSPEPVPTQDWWQTAVSRANTKEELMALYTSNPQLQGNKDFLSAMTSRKKQIETMTAPVSAN